MHLRLVPSLRIQLLLLKESDHFGKPALLLEDNTRIGSNGRIGQKWYRDFGFYKSE